MIDKLEMFIAVATEEHFGRAAEGLGISQPTLSSSIRQLEDQLGVKLIFRGSRFGGLTPEGQLALERARQIVGDARRLREEMRFTRRGLTGQLRIAVIPTALTWSADMVSAFGRRHPDVRFTVHSRNSAEILRMLENIEIDAGITYLDNEPLGRVTTEVLYHETYMLVCARDAEIARAGSVAWSDLAGQKLALLTQDMQNRRIIDRNFADAGVTPNVWIESNSTIILAAKVAKSECFTILPRELASFLASGQKLATVEVTGGRTGHAVGVVAPYQEPHTPMIRALMAEVRKMASAPR